MQACEVTTPLHSVSKMCGQGFHVLFTRHLAQVKDPKTGDSIPEWHRKNNVYKRTFKVKRPFLDKSTAVNVLKRVDPEVMPNIVRVTRLFAGREAIICAIKL